ncbi:MAG: ATP-binding protein [Chitinophagaceae bacterium]
MKKNILLVFIFGLSISSFAQLSSKDLNNLREQWLKAKDDSSRLRIAFDLASGYRFSDIDSSLFYTEQALAIADKGKMRSIRAQILSLKGATLLESGRLPESLQFQFEALNISESIMDTSSKAFALNRIGNTYMELADYPKANEYYFRSKELFESIGDTGMYYNEISNIGNIYELLAMPDSALYFQQIVYEKSLDNNDRNKYTRPEIMFRMGNAYKLKGNKEKALDFYKRGVAESYIDNDLRNLSMNNLLIARLYKEINLPDSSLKYAYQALKTGRTVSFRKGVYEASSLISEMYKNNHQFDSAYKYITLANAEKDSLTGTKRFQELQRIVLSEQEWQRDTKAKRIAIQNKQKQYVLIGGLGIFLIIASILYRNNKQKQKSNKILESTLTNLKSTQSQLIQSEKMASLGELTAGIAHEIQNPLNFVNNFSEVNTELIDEMEQELDKGNLEDAKALAKNIKENEQKINHHGKRADSIVKGMLQHSRNSNGQKELTDINILTDECMRLSYHGLRAKDKTFNAKTETHFDDHLPKINTVSQDIGRVILNLFTNAFYSVMQKKKQRGEGFEPVVTVTTRKTPRAVSITIRDNGNGISQTVIDKIFQPFFTTKPVGEGTGLGLSMSYEIISKGHGGELKADSREGEYAEFTIILPI